METTTSTTDKGTNKNMDSNLVLCDVLAFIEFEKSCKQEMRGGILMYDIKGCHRWLTLEGLFKYWRGKNIT